MIIRANSISPFEYKAKLQRIAIQRYITQSKADAEASKFLWDYIRAKLSTLGWNPNHAWHKSTEWSTNKFQIAFFSKKNGKFWQVKQRLFMWTLSVRIFKQANSNNFLISIFLILKNCFWTNFCGILPETVTYLPLIKLSFRIFKKFLWLYDKM